MLDPISVAIIAALSAGVTSATTDITKQGILDGFNHLKMLIGRKFGNNADVAQAISKLQDDPSSQARKDLLVEELSKVRERRRTPN
jgi:hypothetical protein